MIRNHWPLVLLLVLCSLCCLPLILTRGDTAFTFDETNFYLPAIHRIRVDWPRLNVSTASLSATAPGYQYILASLSFLTGPGVLALRCWNLVISLGLPVVLWFAWPAASESRLRICALLPLVGGCFFIRAASNLMTDNAALLATTASLSLILLPGRKRGVALSGVCAALAVFIRQITIWIEAPLLLRLLGLGRNAPWWALLPAPAVLGWLVLSWGGLVPPAWQTVSGIGYAAAPYQLAVLGVLGLFYLASAGPDWRCELGNRWNWAGAALGLIVALAGPTAPSYEAGRWGGYFWNAAEHLPVIAQRSVLFLVLGPVGGWVLIALARRLWTEAGTETTAIWLAVLGSFLATGLLNRQVHQRYYEPVLLVVLIFWRILLPSSKPAARPAPWRPLAWLSAVQVLITLVTTHGRIFGAI